MLIANAIFERKVDALRTTPCVIEAVEVMSDQEFEDFKNNLLTDRIVYFRQKRGYVYRFVRQNSLSACYERGKR